MVRPSATFRVTVKLTDRLNTKLEAADLEPMTDLVKDFSSGVKLIEVRIPSFFNGVRS
jgi:hypothetical protein